MMFGHLPGSYVAMNLTTRAWQRNLGAVEQRWVYAIGISAGILPDLDALFLPLSEHRASIVHTPFFWLVICAGIAALTLVLPSRRQLLVSIALSILIGAITHLALDAIFVGVKLLYPFSTEYFRFRRPIAWRYDHWVVNYVLDPVFLTELYTFLAAGMVLEMKRSGATLRTLPAVLRSNSLLLGLALWLGLVYAVNWYLVYPLTH